MRGKEVGATSARELATFIRCVCGGWGRGERRGGDPYAGEWLPTLWVGDRVAGGQGGPRGLSSPGDPALIICHIPHEGARAKRGE